ncbi:ABC transporter substrate-binding protein [Pandoraea cepalis]|uniref:ABC transporter substrate-binding protein n=1 Tax=Pandoraea cepalis TaxID=2508294 RepID=A0AAW7MMW9_9BURK|nr:ABC transporter substrate-binding protein [Pandoraea cepalis]MDN4574109.1 ABC transporter substrate-binding protein [Pandoraea cepalis]MDN4579613.1 ABC transporter substrate-binding protein [Pandoraea cepalis]
MPRLTTLTSRLAATVVPVLALTFAVSSHAAEPIRIGAVVSATGAASFLGDPEQKTLNQYVEKLNASGGVLGRQIVLTVYDDGSDANTANAMAKRLILQDKVDLILGASTTGSTMAMAPLATANKVPTISLAAATVIVDPVKPFVFKVPHSDTMAAEKVLEDMKQHGITRFALLSDTGGFGKSGRNETIKAAKRLGMTVVEDQSYGERDTDMTPQLTKARGANPQAVFVFGTGQAPAIVARNFKQLGLNVPLYMSHGQASAEFIRIAGPAAEGVRMPSPALLIAEQLAPADPQRPVSLNYKQSYEAKYKQDVSTFGGYAYDGLMMAVDAIKRAGTTDKAKVRDAIEQTKNFVGVSGVYTMSPTDHMGLNSSAFRMVEIRDGRFVEAK